MLHNLKRTIILGRKLAIPVIYNQNALVWSRQKDGRYFHTTKGCLTKCWNCGNAGTANNIQFKCKRCQHLLDLPANVDHFELLEIEKKFGIDLKTLTNHFRQIQSVLHPDKFGNKTDKEQHLSAEWSSLVNKAYKVLMSPIQRAEYLLKLHQVEISEGNTATNTEFLMNMMERNEQVDAAESKDELLALLQKVQTDNKECIDRLEMSLAENRLVDAKDQVILLRYLLSLENSIKEKGNRIGVVL